MQQSTFLKDETPEVTPQNLGEALQQAIDIEISTIPAYLYTYYSVNRVPIQSTVQSQVVRELIGGGMDLMKAGGVALGLSAQVMVFANKVGATIMSVVMEEMLHLALSSNLKQALAGQPLMTGRSPSSYPAELPGHVPPLKIDLAPFSLNQLKTFLNIEMPQQKPPQETALATLPFHTIGEFYGMIQECIDTNDLPYDNGRPQLVPGKRYYSPNSIDTVYYDIQHKPQYMDADDSGDLVEVRDRDSANQAIHNIVTQGEGNTGAPIFNPDDPTSCEQILNAGFDDPARQEPSHYEKFAMLYCEYQELSKQFTSQGLDADPGKYFVYNVPTNPTTAAYPDAGVTGLDGTQYPEGTLPAVSALLNAVYTYIFLMTEACYQQGNGNTQFEIFMFGIHKSMIFILDALCGEIRALTYATEGQTYNAAPTFENYHFGPKSSPKQQIVDLYNAAVKLAPGLNYLGQRINDLPDVSLA